MAFAASDKENRNQNELKRRTRIKQEPSAANKTAKEVELHYSKCEDGKVQVECCVSDLQHNLQNTTHHTNNITF